MRENSCKIIVILSVTCILASLHLYSGTIRVIPSPKPSHIEKTVIRLHLVKEISLGPGGNRLFYRPKAIVATHNGHFYIYDDFQDKIFKYDPRFQLIKAFAIDTGPPKNIPTGRMRGTKKLLYLSQKEDLHLVDFGSQELVSFTKDGSIIKRVGFPGPNYRLFPVQEEGPHYFAAHVKPGEERLVVMDEKLVEKHALLTAEDYKKFIVHAPREDEEDMKVSLSNPYLAPSFSNTKIGSLPQKEWIVYNSHISKIYYFGSDFTTKKSFNVWPRLAIQYYKKRVTKLRKKLQSDNFRAEMFNSFFIDRDDGVSVYLGSVGIPGNRRLFYQFDTGGELVNTYEFESRPKGLNFCAKANGYFYAFGSGHVFIFQEEKEK